MPKLPMDYSKCCIYKIEHVDDEKLVYVGHTTNFDKRNTKHKSSCCNNKETNYKLKVYQMIRENGGWDMFKMIEVEKYPCNDKREAERRENEVMKDLKANMNMRKSFSTEDENKEIKREYYQSNKPKIQEYTKCYREINKPKLHEKEKKYRELNKAKIQEYREFNKPKMQEYRKKNKAKIDARIKCECGCEIVKRNLKRHQATKNHLDIMKNMNTILQ